MSFADYRTLDRRIEAATVKGITEVSIPHSAFNACSSLSYFNPQAAPHHLQGVCQISAEGPLQSTKVHLYSMLAGSRLCYSGCDCFLKDELCFDASGKYLADSS